MNVRRFIIVDHTALREAKRAAANEIAGNALHLWSFALFSKVLFREIRFRIGV
jgi:hypothetical protein